MAAVVPVESPASTEINTDDGRDPVLIEAEALSIPWKRILQKEIVAERKLRLYLGSPEREFSLSNAVWVLPISLLDSWRTRDRVTHLLWEARSGDSAASVRKLRSLFQHLAGRRPGDQPLNAILKHFWFAYQRIQELRKVARAAEHSRGSSASRIAQTIVSTGCTRSDAEWAVERTTIGRRNSCLDDAVLKTRQEGFELPHAPSAFHSFVLLARFVRKNFPLARRRKRLHDRKPGASKEPDRTNNERSATHPTNGETFGELQQAVHASAASPL